MDAKASVNDTKAAGLVLIGTAIVVLSGCGSSPSKLESTKAIQFLPNHPVVIATLKVDEVTRSQSYKDLLAEISKLLRGENP